MLSDPTIRLALAAGAVVLLVVVVLVSRRKGAGGRGDRQLEQLIRDGRLGEAARRAVESGDLAQGVELYMRAQQPANAASLAARLGDERQAAELYERAGNLERAAHFYGRVGMEAKAVELRAQLRPEPARAPISQPTATPASVASAAGDDRRARGLEAEWRRRHALAGDGAAERAELQRLARGAAEALLAEGDMRRAADLYRDAGLDDEAIHLYVNVLGEPGQAAPIMARAGNHERAAELYEMAGERERAASAWVEVATGSKQPEQYFERIEGLSPQVAVGYFEQQAATHQLSSDTAAIYYHLARALAALGETQRAQQTFVELQAQVGAYRDVAERIAAVRAAPAGGDERGDDAGAASAAEAPAAPMLSDRELQLLASQVAHAAAEQLKRQTDLAALMAASASVQAARLQDAVAGLERQPLQVDLLYDSAVAAAKVGPSIDTLRRFIHGPCDLQNIEVYFRVGLAHLAAGDWAHALEAFDAVEDASPGYRDAWKRADEIRAWQAALGPRMSQLGVVASSPGKADGGDGRYQLRGELGRGGMAVVYRGYDSVLGREVALKFLSEEISAQDDMRELFQREARAVASLNHPNIVTIHDVGVLEGRAFICMEFVDGRSIESLIMESPGLTIVESMRIAKQALDALAYAHGRDIIHRDIKPANMMRTSAGLVKLMDFGLAKSMSDRKKTSYIAGTPAYMAPEHLRGDELDARADLFAIGVSLYEMLSGQLPYAGLDRHEPPVPLAERVPAIPPRLAEAVMRALEFDRARRWPSAEAMVAPIQQILDAVSRFAGGGVGTAPLGDGPASHPGPVGGTAPTVAQVPTGPRRTAERTVALDSGKGTLKLK